VRKIIDRAMAKGASSCEVFLLNSLRTSVDFETGRLKGVSRTEELGAALRVVKDGRMGLATSTRLDDADRLAEDAIATSAHGERVAFDLAAPAALPSVPVANAGVEEFTVDQAIARMEGEIATLLDYDSKLNTEATIQRDIQEITVLTSEGLDASFKRTLYKHYVGGRLVEEGNMLDAADYYGGTTLDDGDDSLVHGVVQDFKHARVNVDVSTGPTKVLFTPRAVIDIMMTLHYGVSGSIVDRKISPLTGRLGETVFDERVTIHDDGLLAGGYESAPFDDEGVPMERTPLFEAGVLRGFLTDLRTARKLDLPQTGNAARVKRLVQTKDIGAVPSPGITNWVMAGGEKPHEELVAGMKDGVIVDRIMGILMSNLIAGDFAGNVAYGLKVEGGAIKGRVKDTMVAGSIYSLLKDQLLELSSDVERVGLLGFVGSHEFPYVLAKDVPISSKS